MNVFINIVCVSLITFVNAGDINYDTILTILKQTGNGAKRRTNLLNPDEKNEIVETMPVIPGFYLQKPKDISSFLFKNPTQWPDALFSNSNSINNSQAGKHVIKNITRDGYLDAKTIKAVKNLNKYRESQKSYLDKLGIWKLSSNGDDNVQNTPVKALVSHVLNSLKNEDIAKKKLKAQKDRKKLENDKVLKQILTEIKGNNRHEKKEKRKNVKKTDNDNKKAKLEALLRNLLKMEKTNSDDVTSSESSESSEEDSYTKESKDGGNILEDILNALNNNDKNIKQSQPIVIIQSEPSNVLRANALSEHIASFRYGLPNSTAFHNNVRNRRQKSSLEHVDYEIQDPDYMHSRKSGSSSKIKANEDTDEQETSEEEELEKNPGNPFTIHKNKYKQNWPYNHYMDGDHMNINPMGPKFGNLGPSGPELFFGRKWWYFNQDDYKPMG